MLKIQVAGVPPLVYSLLWPKETLQSHGRPRCALVTEMSKEIRLLLRNRSVVDVGKWLLN